MSNNYRAPSIPSAFLWKRLHSLTGLWLVLFLIEHLLTNSQAALLFGENGMGFVRGVNFLQDLPYLPVIEIVFLAIPFLIHGIWGIIYLFTAEYNSSETDGSKPALGQYRRNQAYTWQRITSWLLIFGITAHVIHMRFIEYPSKTERGTDKQFITRVNADPGLETLSARLGFRLLDKKEIEQMKSELAREEKSNNLLEQQAYKEKVNFIKALESRSLGLNQLMAVSNQFGIAELLMVRDSFKSIPMMLFYTAFVLIACFHAFNGLWTFMISWGITLTENSQAVMRKISNALMVIIAFLGLAAIWGTYWINLRS